MPIRLRHHVQPIHLLAQSNNDDLSGTIRDFKNYTSKKFLVVINSNT